MARVIDFVPVLSTGIYADNDVLFIPIQVVGVFFQGQPAVLESVIVLDTDDQAQDFDLVFFNASATLGTLNEAITINDTDAAKILGHVSLTAAANSLDLINSTLFSKGGIDLLMTPIAGGSSIWVAGVVRSGTPTYTAAGMKIKLGFR